VTSVAGLDITAPAIAKGQVFFAVKEPGPLTSPSHRATLYAINLVDGQITWKFGTGIGYGTSHVLIADNTIYFRTDKSLSALELETGRQRWSFSADEIGPGLWADDQRLYVVTHKGSLMRPEDTLHALALATGQEQWFQGPSGSARVAMIHDRVVYAGGDRLHALDAATGKELWSFRGTGRESARLMSGDRIFLTSPTGVYFGTKRVDQGYLYAIEAKTGRFTPSK
jgi:outer membrane protein assembly factor BamB